MKSNKVIHHTGRDASVYSNVEDQIENLRAGQFSSAAQISYRTGAGGSVTQATSKSTGVTLNKMSGKISMHNASLNNNTTVSFVLSNSLVAATDVVLPCFGATGTAGAYLLTAQVTTAGSVTISLRNVSGGSLGEAVDINFIVFKSVSA